MTLGQKLRQLRHLEGELRGLGRELTQSELVRAIRQELGATISQSYLSLIEKGTRRHLSQESRQLLATFFKVHPGYLVSDPPGYHTELTSDVASVETALDRIGLHAESRRCLVLLGEMLSMPGLVDRLSQTLVPEEQK